MTLFTLAIFLLSLGMLTFHAGRVLRAPGFVMVAPIRDPHGIPGPADPTAQPSPAGRPAAQAIVGGKRSGRCCALMFLYLDNFKPLNDLHRHDVGVLLLVEVARRLSNYVRQCGTVARIEGDEFVVLLSDLMADKITASSRAAVVAEKIRIQLALPYWLAIKQQADATMEHHCSASIGVVVFIGSEASQDELIKRTDDAMHLAKQAGRNAVRFHSEPPAE